MDLSTMFHRKYSVGALCGIPFVGVKAFVEIFSDVPAGGNCLLLHASHVYIDDKEIEGTFTKKVFTNGYGCCAGAVRAAAYTEHLVKGAITNITSSGTTNIQQFFINQMLLPYSQRLQSAMEPMVELSYVTLDAQTELIDQVVAKSCCHIHNDGHIVLVGGIQINTPYGMSDYFLPLRFDVVDKQGKIIERFCHRKT
jgi:Limiting CO2-inducible proteins B/C beta carbonyic anhydrases